MRFYCHCLNVNIDVLETNGDQEALTQFVPVDLVQYVNIAHEWLISDVPFDRSVHIAWQSLLQVIPVREMKLNRCLGCHLFTHVTNIAPSQILINKDLFNETMVKEVYEDPSYSKTAKIVLPNMTNSLYMPRLSASQDENNQRESEFAQQIFRQSAQDLEQETEEKIRIYQYEQEQFLTSKKKTVR